MYNIGSQTDETRDTLGDSLQGRRQGYWSRNANPPRAEYVLMGSAGVRFLVRSGISRIDPLSRDSSATLHRGNGTSSSRIPDRQEGGPPAPRQRTPLRGNDRTFRDIFDSECLVSSVALSSPMCFFLLTSDE